MALHYQYVITFLRSDVVAGNCQFHIHVSTVSLRSLLLLLDGPSPPCLSWGPDMESMVHQDTPWLLHLRNPEGHLSGLALLVILHGDD